jgi:hypothetical protein
LTCHFPKSGPEKHKSTWEVQDYNVNRRPCTTSKPTISFSQVQPLTLTMSLLQSLQNRDLHCEVVGDPWRPIGGNPQQTKGLPCWDAYGKHHPSQSCLDARPHHSVLVDSASCTLHPQRSQEQKKHFWHQDSGDKQVLQLVKHNLHLLKKLQFCFSFTDPENYMAFQMLTPPSSRLTVFRLVVSMSYKGLCVQWIQALCQNYRKGLHKTCGWAPVCLGTQSLWYSIAQPSLVPRFNTFSPKQGTQAFVLPLNPRLTDCKINPLHRSLEMNWEPWHGCRV